MKRMFKYKKKRYVPPKKKRLRRWKVTKKKPYRPRHKNTYKLFKKKNPIFKYMWFVCICAIIIFAGFLFGKLAQEIRNSRSDETLTMIIQEENENYKPYEDLII